MQQPSSSRALREAFRFFRGTLCLVLFLGFSGWMQAANFTTIVQQPGGQSWLGNIWDPGATTPTAGNTYECIAGGNPTRVRNPAVAGVQTFPGDSLTMDANSEIRAKQPGATLDFPGVGGAAGLILNGGNLDTGDNAVFPLTGVILVQADSSFSCGDTGGNNSRGWQIGAQIRGSANLTVVKTFGGGVPAVEVTSVNNPFTGSWIVTSGGLKGTGAGSLGTGSIIMSPTNAALNPTVLDVLYNITSTGTLVLTNGGQMNLHQSCTFGDAIIEGVHLSAGLHSYADLRAAYPANFLPGGSGNIWIGTPAIIQDIGTTYIAWEAEYRTTINNAGSASWAVIPDVAASGGSALAEQGASDTVNAAATAQWTLVFQRAGTYQLYIKYLLNPCCGANSYKFPAAFGTFGPTDPAWKVSSANENGTGPGTYTVIKEREQNQTTVFATFTVNPSDVGQPLVFQIGNREAPGLTIDRIALSTDPNLANSGNAAFDALVNSSGGTQLLPNPAPISADSRLNPNGLRVTFQAPVNATGLNPANYTLDNGVTVSAAAYADSSSNVIQLTTSPLTLGTTYTLTVNNVANLDGIVINPNPSVTTFLHGAGLNQPAGLTVNIYNGANTIALVKTAIATCAAPTFTANTTNVAMEYTTSERSTVAEGNTFLQPNTDNYGTWIYGEFVPPTTGNYQFALSSDDNSELWLSTDSSPAHKVLLTSQAAWNGYRGFISGNGNPAPSLPAPVSLAAGQRYYLEVVEQEGGGGDHVSVAVRKPGDPAIADNMLPIPRSMFATNYSLGCPPNFFFSTLGPVVLTSNPTNITVTELFTATFAALVDGSPPYSVQWYSNGVAVAGATSQIYSFQTLRYANGAQYYAIVNNDFSSATSSVATLTVISDTIAPTLVQAYGSGQFTNATVVFSEPVLPSNGTNIANYSITNSAGVSLAILSATLRDNSNVVLRTAAQTPGERYTVVVNNVTDRAGVPNVIAANSTVSFSGWVFTAGFALMEVYPTGGGTTIPLLTGHPSYPNYPRERYYITSADSRVVYPDDTHDNYGARISGLFIPATNGNYVFRLANDDDAQLNGSLTDNSAAKQTLINVACCNGPATGAGTYAGPASPTLTLTGGNRYYYEVLWKEGGGGDYGRLSFDNNLPVQSPLLGVYANPDAVSLVITQQPATQTHTVNGLGTFRVGTSFASFDGAIRTLAYQWRSNGVDIVGANGATYTTQPLTLADEGTVYSVQVAAAGATLVSSNAVLHVVDDNVPPVLISATTDASFKIIQLNWSELMSEGAAIEAGSYIIYDSLSNLISVTTVDYAGSNVVLHLSSALQPDSIYYFEADYQADLAGNPTDKVGTPHPDGDQDHGVVTNIRTFVISRGFTLFSAYYGLPSGQNIDAFVAMPIYPNSPTFSFYTNVVNWPQTANPNVEQYAMRFSGLFLATETGTYRFDPAHDDDFRLQISSDDSPANQTANSLAGGCCTGLTGGPTLDVAMVAGSRYYYELIVREYGGGDYAGIGVTTPSGANIAPMNASFLAVAVDPAIGDTNGVGIAQQPQDQTILDNHKATFSVVVTNPGPFGAAYQWQVNSGGGFADIPGAAFASYTTPFRTVANDGEQYRVKVFVLGKTVISAPATLHVTTDTGAPHIALVTGGGSTVTVYFDEAMDPAAVGNLAKYELKDSANNVLALSSPVIAPDNSSVAFTSPAQTLGALYTLHAQDVPDVAGNPLAPTDVTFKSGRGYGLFQAYDTSSTPGNSVGTLTAHPNYPDSPRDVALIPTFDSRNVYPDDSHEQYGARMSGWFLPAVTGNYIFYLRSDDSSELWLSTDNTVANKVKIQEELGCCNSFSVHTSAPQALTAGQAYYIELLYKEGTGGDFGQAAFKLATDPTPPDSLTPISGIFLSAVDPGLSGLPQLTAQRDSSNNLVITWPGSFTGFTLETAPTIPSATWTPVSSTVVNGENTATIPIPASGMAFYRLRK